MIKKFAKGSIFCFSNSAYYFMRVELNGIPCAVRLYDGEVFTEVDFAKNGYINPKGQYKDLDALYFEEKSARSLKSNKKGLTKAQALYYNEYKN